MINSNNDNGKPPEEGEQAIDLDVHWERVRTHHKAAGKAFVDMISASVEIVLLKLLIEHGQFTRQAQEKAPELSIRSIRDYRQFGERYLSAAHGRVMTVRVLRAAKQRPQEELCSQDAIAGYLQEKKLICGSDLKKHAEELVPDLVKSSRGTKRGSSRVKNIFHKVKRAWSGMTSAQRAEFETCFDQLRKADQELEPPKPTA